MCAKGFSDSMLISQGVQKSVFPEIHTEIHTGTDQKSLFFVHEIVNVARYFT